MVSTGFTTEVTITTTNTQPSPSSSWLSSISAIMCAPLASCFGRKSRRSKSPPLTATSISWPLGRTSDQDLLIGPDEKQLPTTRTQPAREALPVARQGSGTQRPATSERVPRKSFGSMRSGAPGKKRWRSDGSRRPKISKPTDFRHLETGSFHFPPPEPQPQPQSQPLPSQLRSAHPERSTSFRPLELSIYLHNNRMSPLLPQFDIPSTLPPPEPTHLRHRLDDDHKLFHQKSHQSIPFHIPRKAVGSINSDANEDNAPNAPAIPPKAQGRARAYTSPEVDAIKDRVADAMNEIERLQKKIDDVIERQSVYSSSRPSTSHSMAHTTLDLELEPMPTIPALPPSEPSFAARLNCEVERPQTAPLAVPFEHANRSQTFGGEPQTQTTASTPTYPYRDDAPLPPPLPLVLRPPLRKKKSFSRVSTWLFPERQHSRNISLDSVTNLPQPVKGTDGFYQCVPDGSGAGRQSFDSVGTVTTWESDDEHRTVPTTWSPGSTPASKQGESQSLERVATFGSRPPPRKSSLAIST